MKILRAALLLAAALAAALSAPPAQASVGYELSSSKPSKTLAGAPRGLAVDQASHDIYAAITSLNPSIGTPGELNRFNSDLTADGVFAAGSGYYTGVAVNPLTQGFYAVQVKIDVPQGSFGVQKMDLFSPAGSAGGSFSVPDAEALPPLATDSGGRVFYPYTFGHSVQIYNSTGVLQEEVTCSGCPGGAFGQPLSVATDSANNLYVADASPDRVVKLSPSGGSYAFASVVQSGRNAAAVGVDPSTGDVFVGDTPNNRDYHIVAYNSSGVQFDDFGGDLFPDPPPERPFQLAYQMAVDGTTHKLYVGNPTGFYVFEKVTIAPPGATIAAAGSIGQLTATLNATVSPEGHAALSCTFELTTAADVGFASAKSLPCAENPSGSTSKAVSAGASGLSPGSSYLYRVKATTNAGSVTSGSQGFETLPEAPPTVTAEAPQNVTEITANLRAKVNSNGGTVSNCHFEFGTTTSYGTNFSCTGSIPPVSSAVVVSKKASALISGTTYHYRLVVTTNAGTTQGDDVKFVTKSPSSVPEPENPAPSPAPSIPPATIPPPSSEGPITTHHPLHCKKGFRKRKVRGKVRCVKVKRRHRHHARR
jgi:hypothetical protein